MMGFSHQQASTEMVIQETNFKVSRDFWITLVSLEIEKISELLTYSQYKTDRNSHSFPWQELKELKKYVNRK